jgi:hypothetical protein
MDGRANGAAGRRALVRARLGDQLDKARSRSRPAFLVVWAGFAGSAHPIHRIGVRGPEDLDALFAILWDVHPESRAAGIRWTLETGRPGFRKGRAGEPG